MSTGRARGRPKPKVEEPVILTLISDDEDDDKKVNVELLQVVQISQIAVIFGKILYQIQ